MIEHYDAAWEQLLAPGATYEMTPVTVRGVGVHVYRQAPSDLRVFWQEAAGAGTATYLVYEDERYTYAQIDAQVRALADVLAHRYGVGRGDRVAIAMRNYPEWVVGFWATVSLGAVAVGMNAWWTGAEMEYGLTDSSPTVLIADAERVERVLPLLAGLRSRRPLAVLAVRTPRDTATDSVEHWDDVVDTAAAPASLPAVAIDPDDTCTVFYTSGTTGKPKGAELTHRGSVHNVWNAAFMTAAATLAESLASGNPPRPSRPPVSMAATPLFHVTANNSVLHIATRLGGTVVLMRRWDPGRALELIEREQVSGFYGVPTMSRELLAHPDWSERDVSTLRRLSGGGAAVQPDLVAKIVAALPSGGPSSGYGLTETHGIVTTIAGAMFASKPTSCGRAAPTIDVRLIDPDGVPLPPGPEITGELCVRGPNVIKGYLNRPDATAEAIHDGWFHTGDIARIDADGFVHIVDRIKDMVNRGGENVYCSEVEAAIYEHPAVLEAAVFGIPDDRLGEAVAATVVVRPGASLAADELHAFLAERIAAFKIPAAVAIRGEALPRNANGKFLKRELRDAFTRTDTETA